MLKSKSVTTVATLLVTFVLCDVEIAVGLSIFGENCTVVKRPDGVTVDPCDFDKGLICTEGQCLCQDPVNQVYTYRIEPVPESGLRKRRSPGKGSKGTSSVVQKGIKSVTKSKSKSHSKSSHNNHYPLETTTEAPPKFVKVFKCYAKVDSPCLLDDNQSQGSSGVTTTTSGSTSTTATGPTTTSGPTSSTTTVPTTTGPTTSTTTSTPTISNSTFSSTLPPALNIDLISKQCVQNAICSPQTNPSGIYLTNSTTTWTPKMDPRVGKCVCQNGFFQKVQSSLQTNFGVYAPILNKCAPQINVS